MSITSRIRSIYLSHFSKPEADRPIYREIRRQHVRKIVVLGIGDGVRALRMIEVARETVPPQEIQFTGMDLFEARGPSDEPGLTLKETHRMLHATGVRVRLVPGDLLDGLAATANSLGQVDLLILTHRLDPLRLARAWFYVPRLLREGSLVFLEKPSPEAGVSLERVPRHEIDAMAAAAMRRRAA